jgi:hypothetical protein
MSTGGPAVTAKERRPDRGLAVTRTPGQQASHRASQEIREKRLNPVAGFCVQKPESRLSENKGENRGGIQKGEDYGGAI